MSSLTHDRLRTKRQICWPAYREQREHLAEIFPAIAYNGGNKVPLALGVKYDLIGANTGFSAADIRHFLRAYTFGPKYLRMLKVGARRYALDGTVDGFVNENEARYASLCLKAHNAMRHLLRRKKVRAGVVRAVEDALFHGGVWPECAADDMMEAA